MNDKRKVTFTFEIEPVSQRTANACAQMLGDLARVISEERACDAKVIATVHPKSASNAPKGAN